MQIKNAGFAPIKEHLTTSGAKLAFKTTPRVIAAGYEGVLENMP